MIKRVILTVACALTLGAGLGYAGTLGAGQKLTLDSCKHMARDNYPAIRQYGLIAKTRDLTMSNAAKAWLPQVSVTGGAYGFTDIVKNDAAMQGMGLDMKTYVANVAAVVRQNVYDGGQTAANKRLAAAQADVQEKELDVSMYGVNGRVEELFFGVLVIDEQLAQNELLQKDLGISRKTVESMMRGGIANQSDLDAVDVERLKAVQQSDALKASRKAYVQMLGEMTGHAMGDDVEFERPTAMPAGTTVTGNNRPELKLIDSRNRMLDEQRKQLDTRLRPTVSLFGAGMAHSKLSSRVNNGVLLGGVSLSWNIGALYSRKNDIGKLELQRQMNESQRDVFNYDTRLQSSQTSGTIEALQKQIATDGEIVRLRESIREKGDKKVRLGTESVNELMRDINAVAGARTQKALHEVQLLREQYRLKNINNE